MNKICLFFLLVFTFFLSFSPVLAQDISLGVANYVPVEGDNIEDGSIVSFAQEGYFLTKEAYDPKTIGIVNLKPAVAFEVKMEIKTYPVISSGIVYVRVNTGNGGIKKGDLIASSTTPGVGMKATQSGYVVGSALDDFSESGVGKIPLYLNLHPYYLGSTTSQSLWSIFNLGALGAFEKPSTVLKYIIAGILVIISLVAGFFSFGMLARTGVEALGRNPLAGRTIQVGIALNVIITVAIIASGLAIAYLVLRL